jgi:hypothetical protein
MEGFSMPQFTNRTASAAHQAPNMWSPLLQPPFLSPTRPCSIGPHDLHSVPTPEACQALTHRPAHLRPARPAQSPPCSSGPPDPCSTGQQDLCWASAPQPHQACAPQAHQISAPPGPAPDAHQAWSQTCGATPICHLPGRTPNLPRRHWQTGLDAKVVKQNY